MKRIVWFFLVIFAVSLLSAQQSAQVLAGILEEKGILTSADRARIVAAAPDEAVQLMAAILRDKGLLSVSEVARVGGEHTTTVAAAPPPRTESAPVTRPVMAAPAIVSKGKLPITVYGTVLLNAFSNTSLNNNEDIPLFAGKQGTDPTGGDKNFGMTARQSRFGMTYDGLTIGNAKVSGQLEFDLFGGAASLPNAVGFDIIRARLAFGRVDWTNFSLEAGEDWSPFAPLNLTSLASFAIPELAASGNLWSRPAQIRAEFRHKLSDTSMLQFQIAATDSNLGDNPSTVQETRTAGIGERGRLPGTDSRLSWNNKQLAFGLSAHYSRGKNAGTIGTTTVQRGVDSWGVAGDYTIPITKYFTLTGEAYEGRALGIFSSALGESVGAVGTNGEHGVESRGGFIQAQTNFNKKWQNNIAYGIDSMNAHQIVVGSRDKTQTYMTNVIYKWRPDVNFSLEYRRFLTHFRNQLVYDELGDHINLAVAFFF